MQYSRRSILTLSFLVEGVLVAIFFIWAGFRNFNFVLVPELWELGWGLFFAVPLFIVNFLLFGPLCERWDVLSACLDFRERVVKPLASHLDLASAAIVSACAGIGEELFFRGVLQPELGLIISSLLFSVLHFGTAVIKYPLIALLYFLIGIYFGVIHSMFESLWVLIIAHASYDTLAFYYLGVSERDDHKIDIRIN